MERVQDERWRETIEPPIDPEVPICDAHHHLWDHREKYLLAELLADIGTGHRVTSTVFVEGHARYHTTGPRELQPVGETEFAESIAVECAMEGRSRTAVAAGIVARADLSEGSEVARVLEAHLAASPGRMRGVRDAVTWDADPRIRGSASTPGRMGAAAYRAGFACLHRYRLSYDAWLFHTQLSELVDLAHAFPDASIVLNHAGGPLGMGRYADKREEVWGSWKRGMMELARCPNVLVKLSGLGMPRCGFGWNERNDPPDSIELAAAMAPYYLTCIDLFGPDRCMFGSNFPPDKVSYSYSVLWNSIKRMIGAFSGTEQAALLHDTAVRVYRLASTSRQQ